MWGRGRVRGGATRDRASCRWPRPHRYGRVLDGPCARAFPLKFYAGVGSRQTPIEILEICERVAERLAFQGWVLRSGHAPGADQAFEGGAGGAAEIFLPWPSFENSEPIEAGTVFGKPNNAAYELASFVHPGWDRMTGGGRALHARNCHQVLGRDLHDPVRFVLCWTPDGQVKGGTATAIRLAEHYGIPVYNFADRKIEERITEFASSPL